MATAAWQERPSADTLCIELTPQCPLQCIHCSANAAPGRRGQLGVEAISSALDTYQPLAEIYLSGGEPLAHPEILSIVQVCSRFAEKAIIYSSGVISRGSGIMPVSNSFLSALKRAGVYRVDLSLYSANPAEHDEFTQTEGSFAATIETCRRLSAMDIRWGVHFVPLSNNGESLIGIHGLSKTLGASRLHVLAVAPQGRANRNMHNFMPRQSLLSALKKIQSQDPGLELVISSELRKLLGTDEITHRDNHRAAFLDYMGYVYPGEGERRLEMRSDSSILRGESLRTLIEQARSKGARFNKGQNATNTSSI